ncbi:hypothetical protein K1T73_03445 [Roseovarius sp. SCSIO 43702]|uniref:protein-disulfide reductase DsbD domain-containing protein n=1 Tax=Roseovarius sp. SCSIO 43702 TaxID=2823043 RepID=UPI001C7342DF|nr:protein-disulfide reductase DsbD domain-containing protein [Roseovarius sp. SCSIO 43702]QYX57467.1 hypothetical protein K1T73_03445 [Roseovarius sp. SCSIO 43702]
MKQRLLTLLALLCLLAPPALADESVVSARILPGWRMADGTHMAGLELTLDRGWKTYWRAPGDAGIPPEFDWRGSRNLAGARVLWPRPRVYDDAGLLTIGYKDRVVLPLAVKPGETGGDVTLDTAIDMGVCRDVCVPVQLHVTGTLPASVTRPDPAIAAALAARPLDGDEAGAGAVTCRIAPAKGGLTLTAQVMLPPTGGEETVVVETSNPEVWVAPVKTSRSGNGLSLSTYLAHASGRPFAVDRSGLRFTVLGAQRAVEIEGCTGG